MLYNAAHRRELRNEICKTKNHTVTYASGVGTIFGLQGSTEIFCSALVNWLRTYMLYSMYLLPILRSFTPNCMHVGQKSIRNHSVLNPRPTVVVRPTATGGGGLKKFPSYLRNAGPIFKIQTVFDSPAKVVDRNLILLTSGSLMTS